jgi:hypothetical protein
VYAEHAATDRADGADQQSHAGNGRLRESEGDADLADSMLYAAIEAIEAEDSKQAFLLSPFVIEEQSVVRPGDGEHLPSFESLRLPSVAGHHEAFRSAR